MTSRRDRSPRTRLRYFVASPSGSAGRILSQTVRVARRHPTALPGNSHCPTGQRLAMSGCTSREHSGRVTAYPEIDAVRDGLALLRSCRVGDAEERFFDCASRPGDRYGRSRERIRHRDAPLRMTCGEGVREQRTRFRLKFEDVNRARWLLALSLRDQPAPQIQTVPRRFAPGTGRSLLLPFREFFAVGDELGVGAGAQFVEVHALPLAFGTHSLRVDAVE